MFGHDPIVRIRESLAEVAGEDRRGWSAAARSARVAELVDVRERLDAELLRCVGEWDAQSDWAVDGMLGPRAWLKQHTPVTGMQASRIVSAARLVRRHEATGAALAAGEISSAHLEVLAPLVRGREEEYAEHEATLVEAARRLKPDDVAVVGRRWREIVDDHQDARRMFERRGLGVATTLGGMGWWRASWTPRPPRCSSRRWSWRHRPTRSPGRSRRARCDSGGRTGSPTSAGSTCRAAALTTTVLTSRPGSTC
jgi:hypothetical protein